MLGSKQQFCFNYLINNNNIPLWVHFNSRNQNGLWFQGIQRKTFVITFYLWYWAALFRVASLLRRFKRLRACKVRNRRPHNSNKPGVLEQRRYLAPLSHGALKRYRQRINAEILFTETRYRFGYQNRPGIMRKRMQIKYHYPL